MNSLIKINKTFKSEKGNHHGIINLPKGSSVSTADALTLANELTNCLAEWQGRDLLEKVLIDVCYKKVVAKSNRISVLLSEKTELPENSIQGVRFAKPPNLAHVITHYVSESAIKAAVDKLNKIATILNDKFAGSINGEGLRDIQKATASEWSKITDISRSEFSKIIHDICFIDHLCLTDNAFEPINPSNDSIIVTLYKTEQTANPRSILNKLGISVNSTSCLENAVLLNSSDYSQLAVKAPYLIAMQTEDVTKFPAIPLGTSSTNNNFKNIPSPGNEPCVGVIDTPFDTRHPPYFSEWVEYHNCLGDDSISLFDRDYSHGTAVSSIVVDGANLNPDLEDGCGRFRVRHFGVATSAGFSSFEMIKKLEKILSENRDIRVWNLSLGSPQEISKNFISPEAAIIDELQVKYGVIFVIAGTNNNLNDNIVKIGAPADSINSLVVNSVRRDNQPASYSRIGPVLEFFVKPDVAYYGGDINDKLIRTCVGSGEYMAQGTSFATPFVTRKLAFLIEKAGLSIEAAKALIIDSSQQWAKQSKNKATGHGIVPINIKDILGSNNDEIKFLISGTASQYSTYCYEIPVPIVANHFPYIARATLCYSPICDKNMGVDYTCTELDLHFGRTKGTTIKSINANTQNEEGNLTSEQEARNSLRKWDNVKIISEELKKRSRKRIAYDSDYWGFRINKTSRYQSAHTHESQRFSMVVTLKELDGANRHDVFIRNCAALGWSVNEIEVDNQIDIYEEGQTEIEWE